MQTISAPGYLIVMKPYDKSNIDMICVHTCSVAHQHLLSLCAFKPSIYGNINYICISEYIAHRNTFSRFTMRQNGMFGHLNKNWHKMYTSCHLGSILDVWNTQIFMKYFRMVCKIWPHLQNILGCSCFLAGRCFYAQALKLILYEIS